VITSISVDKQNLKQEGLCKMYLAECLAVFQAMLTLNTVLRTSGHPLQHTFICEKFNMVLQTTYNNFSNYSLEDYG